MHITHELKPFFDKNSKVLILGSIPSVKSREIGFYYAHPQNRFYKTLAGIYNEPIDTSIKARKEFLKKHYIALYDVIASCDIDGSSDSSITNPVPNNLSPILNNANIKAIFTTGKKAYDLYQKYIYPTTKIKAIPLPSTSAAHCPKDINQILFNSYSQIKDYTDS